MLRYAQACALDPPTTNAMLGHPVCQPPLAPALQAVAWQPHPRQLVPPLQAAAAAPAARGAAGRPLAAPRPPVPPQGGSLLPAARALRPPGTPLLPRPEAAQTLWQGRQAGGRAWRAVSTLPWRQSHRPSAAARRTSLAVNVVRSGPSPLPNAPKQVHTHYMIDSAASCPLRPAARPARVAWGCRLAGAASPLRSRWGSQQAGAVLPSAVHGCCTQGYTVVLHRLYTVYCVWPGRECACNHRMRTVASGRQATS